MNRLSTTLISYKYPFEDTDLEWSTHLPIWDSTLLSFIM